jgi:hypothetical protein
MQNFKRNREYVRQAMADRSGTVFGLGARRCVVSMDMFNNRISHRELDHRTLSHMLCIKSSQNWCSELSSGLYCRVKDCRPTFQRCVLPPSSGMKRRSTIILHGSITQKTTLNIILAAVRTWNLTSQNSLKTSRRNFFKNVGTQVTGWICSLYDRFMYSVNTNCFMTYVVLAPWVKSI